MHSRGQGPRKRVWATGRAALGSGVAGPGVCAPGAAAAAAPGVAGPEPPPPRVGPAFLPGSILNLRPAPRGRRATPCTVLGNAREAGPRPPPPPPRAPRSAPFKPGDGGGVGDSAPPPRPPPAPRSYTATTRPPRTHAHRRPRPARRPLQGAQRPTPPRRRPERGMSGGSGAGRALRGARTPRS